MTMQINEIGATAPVAPITEPITEEVKPIFVQPVDNLVEEELDELDDSDWTDPFFDDDEDEED